jgi:hypothetical protein
LSICFFPCLQENQRLMGFLAALVNRRTGCLGGFEVSWRLEGLVSTT